MKFAARISLASFKKRGGALLQGAYRKADGTEVFLVNNGTRVVTGQLSTTDRVTTQSISADKTIELEIDDENIQSIAVLDFYKNHPAVKCEGHHNPNVKGEQFFELFIPKEKEALDYRRLQEMTVVLDIVRDMSDENMRDLSFVLGGDPRDMSSQAVYLDLIGTAMNGRAVSEPIKTLNYLKLKRSESESLLYANKAVRFGIAEKRDGMYYINERPIGATIDQMAHMFRTDSDLFDGYIRKVVDDKAASSDKSRVGDRKFSPKSIPDDLKDLIPAIADRKDKATA